MLVEDRESFHVAIDGYLNIDLLKMEVHGPSSSLEEDFRSGNSKFPIPFVHVSPVEVFYGLALLGQEVDKLNIKSLFVRSEWMARKVVIALRVEEYLTSDRESQELKKLNLLVRPLVALLYRAFKPNLDQSLNEFYGWVKDTEDPFHLMKCYLSVGWLRGLEDIGVQLDPDVSIELSRIRQRFPNSKWPDLKGFKEDV